MTDDRNRFRIVLMNAGGGQEGLIRGPALRRATLMEIIQNQYQIVFFQELRLVQATAQNWLGAPYLYIGHREAGIAYDTKFSATRLDHGDLEQQLHDFDNDFQPLPRMSAVEMTVKETGQKFLCISWHGPHNIGIEARLLWFENLMAFLERLLRKYSLPLIVGGDFNIAVQEIEDFVDEPFTLEHHPDMLRPNGAIDFYIISDDLELQVLNFVDFANGNPGFLDHRPLSAKLIVPDPLEDIRFLFLD